jgi:hypothetical protein
MDWLKLAVDLPDHPQVAELSAPAFRALIATWCYAARFETDGHIPHQAHRTIGLTTRLAGELEVAGLLHRNGRGWYVHDWDDHQPTAEEIARRREMASKRQASYRRRIRGEDGTP